MTFEEIKARLNAQFSEAITGEDLSSTPETLVIEKSFLVGICDFLMSEEGLYFDSLSCVTGIDNGPDKNTMEVVYNLYSIPYNHHLMLRVELERENPNVDSLTSLWKTADWHERETFDLLGIRFHNHPDLRRILMPNDWEGHPLRKDYQEQEKYHGMTVVYDRDEPAN